MRPVVRQLRSAFVIATSWGALWAAIGVSVTLLLAVVRPQEIGADEGPGKVAAVLGLVGFLSGLGFAGLLCFAEKGQRFSELSMRRIALWGFIGGAAIPALVGADIGEGWITGILGAIFAAGSLALARQVRSLATDPSALPR